MASLRLYGRDYVKMRLYLQGKPNEAKKVVKMAIKRDACDKWFSDVVRQKAGFQCEHCGKQGGRMECAHIYGRSAKSVRWSLDNAVCLCHYCHRTFTAMPLEFSRWCVEYLGASHMEILREKWNVLMPTNKKLRDEISAFYRAEYRAMLHDPSYDPVSYN